MIKHLLPGSGNFYKANLHCHTTISDGRKTPEEVRRIYKEQGYSVVAFTDHDVFIPHPELAEEDFLPLNGFEIEINEWNKPWEHTKSCHGMRECRDKNGAGMRVLRDIQPPEMVA